MFSQERGCRRKECFRVEACNARRNRAQRRLEPHRRCPETGAEQADRASECAHLSGGNRTARSFGGFAARAKLSQPPNAAGIGNDRECPHLLAGIINHTSNRDDIGTDLARGNMRTKSQRD